MQYRKFGNLNIELSILGFGAMRLPALISKDKTVYDYEQSARMMLRAYELGVNYFDTAPGYCGGESEIIVGRALKGFRSKVYLSTKNPIENESGKDFRIRLENSLKKLDTGYIDFYYMWGINLDAFNNLIIKKDGPLEAARKAKEEGLIRHISFSFHDDASNLTRLINAGCFESMLVQYNLLDRSNEQGIKEAHNKGLGTVVMGPVGGGRLGITSKQIAELIPGGVKSSPELALRFVLTNQNVCCALSGMSTMEQVEENCRVAADPSLLTDGELKAIEAAMLQHKNLSDLYCTGCKYCMPCPMDVNIPLNFELMNYHKVYGLTEYARAEYQNIGKFEWMPGKTASACTECGECEKKCPQKIKIRAQLKETHAELA